MIIINIDEKQVFEQFPDILDKYITNKVYKIINSLGIECSDYGTIISVETDEEDNALYATVKVSDGTETGLLQNLSGTNLIPGDTVKIYGSRTNLSNRYIGVKCNSEQ